jgi:hypothetical protein
MKITLFAVLFAGFVTVAHSAEASDLPFLDRVVSPEEYSQNKQLRKRVVDACMHGSFELRKDPNCVNAGKSLSKDQLRNDVPNKF